MRHEFGHCAGLDHQNDSAARLMFWQILPNSIKQIAQDELNGLAFLYDMNNTNIRARMEDGTLPHDTQGNYVGAGGYDNATNYVGYKGPNWNYGAGCCALASLAGMTWSNATGASSWFVFNGSRITYEYTKAYNRGQMSIYLDNQQMVTFNGVDANNKLWRVRRTFDVAPGRHVIEVRGQGGGSATGYTDTDTFWVDVARAGTGSRDDANPDAALVYLGLPASWTACNTCANAANGTITWSNVKDNAIQFTFVGHGVTYVYTKHYNRGYVKVTIDGVQQPSIDLYANTQPGGGVWQQSTTYNLSSGGTHTIHLAVEGTKNPAAADYYIDLDRFIVLQ